MFSKEDYELPLEKQLRLRVIDDEIDQCDDIEVLRSSCKAVTSMLTTYQHLLAIAVRKSIEKELLIEPGDDTIELMIIELSDG